MRIYNTGTVVIFYTELRLLHSARTGEGLDLQVLPNVREIVDLVSVP
jgi:hypothetical protein